MSNFEFNHNFNRVIEACAETLEEKMGFNPLQVLRCLQLFPIDFFENTPHVSSSERENWYYLRDRGSHSALIFNFETKNFRFIDNNNYWNEDILKFFRKSEEELKKENIIYKEKMKKAKETFVYKKLKPVIKKKKKKKMI